VTEFLHGTQEPALFRAQLTSRFGGLVAQSVVSTAVVFSKRWLKGLTSLKGSEGSAEVFAKSKFTNVFLAREKIPENPSKPGLQDS
jgi:hypothetical protein